MNKENNLPSNWSWAKLGDVCEINPKLDATEIDDETEVSFLPMKAVEELTGKIDLVYERKFGKVKKGYTYFGNGDVIFAKITPCMENGKVAITTKLKNEIGFGSTEFHVLRPKNKLLNKFLFNYLIQSSYRKLAQRNMTGTAGQLRVPKRFIENSVIPLPPLSEQKKIVEKIEELFSSLDSGVASLKKAKAQIRLYRQSVLAAAFSGRLTRKDDISSRDIIFSGKAAEPKPEYSNQLPGGWKWVKLGEIIKVSSGKGLTSANMLNEGRYPVYGGNGVSGYYNEYLFEEPRLIIGRVGAKCGVVHITKPNSWVTDNALVVDFISNDVVMKFLYHCLDFHNLNKLSVSTAQPVISGAKIYPYKIMLPPLNQQLQIVEEIEKRFSEADNLEKAIDESLNKAESLRQSILKQAFEGKLV